MDKIKYGIMTMIWSLFGWVALGGLAEAWYLG